MNLANKFTLFRVILIPAFIAVVLTNFPYHYLISLVIFSVASITDAIDGHLARSKQMVTTFGKFLDPLADKALVVSALICLIDLDWTWCVLVVIIVIREFLVTSLRLVAINSDGAVIAASIWGKLKTTTQMCAIVGTLSFAAFEEIFPDIIQHQTLYIISLVLMSIATVMTVISGVDYLYKYKGYIDTTK